MMNAFLRARARSRRILAAALTAAAALVGAVIAAPPAAASEPSDVISSIIERGSEWSYDASGHAPAEGWQTAALPWDVGSAPFGLGSRAGRITTRIDAGPERPPSVYFSKSFTLTDDLPEWSWINTWADDGIVVWVNGVEVGRKNAPKGEVTADSAATAAPSSRAARSNPTSFSVPVALLHQGVNTIAVQVLAHHRRTRNLSFDAHLVREDIGGAGVPAPSSSPAPSPSPSLSPSPTPPASPSPAPSLSPSPSASSSPEPEGETCGAQGMLAPQCGALWGVYDTGDGDDLAAGVTDLEATVGRRFDMTMRYHDFSTHPQQGVFPDEAERELGQDRTLLFSWQARVSDTDTDIAWSRIARGELDGYIDSAADRIAAFGHDVMIAFDPEFDIEPNRDKGSMADYVAAYRRVHDRFAAKGVTNVAWAWVSSGYLGDGNDDRIRAAYPGDAYVDWVGYDPYNFYTCNGTPWTTFGDKIDQKYHFFTEGSLATKPQILTEYGTSYNVSDPDLAARWHREIPAALKEHPNLKALVRFNAGGALGSGEPCQLQIDNGAGMLDSFRDAGLDPYVNTRED
ncbi:glycoside hydrolase family 26 protein [Microbacterium sp. p3-SID336]|uniref:glycoside hydrolase family 26 protein n=1 Tax=Microbacterium sp. p3-SID336 TaxID=2916212 RepID=UPI0021A51344|nr:glycosyl hydrolase [Microbacterium sp. p3-SID336]MCT1477125.1 hypothetical protein [Microbacterium sp. p3-SID336]